MSLRSASAAKHDNKYRHSKSALVIPGRTSKLGRPEEGLGHALDEGMVDANAGFERLGWTDKSVRR
jgi:hypothetical protein